MPAGWRQSSVGSSTPAAELPAVVATKVGGEEGCEEKVTLNVYLSIYPLNHEQQLHVTFE
jgi:hypothetical protein